MKYRCWRSLRRSKVRSTRASRWPRGCPRTRQCGLQEALQEVTDNSRRQLEAIKLSQLLEPPSAESPSRPELGRPPWVLTAKHLMPGLSWPVRQLPRKPATDAVILPQLTSYVVERKTMIRLSPLRTATSENLLRDRIVVGLPARRDCRRGIWTPGRDFRISLDSRPDRRYHVVRQRSTSVRHAGRAWSTNSGASWESSTCRRWTSASTRRKGVVPGMSRVTTRLRPPGLVVRRPPDGLFVTSQVDLYERRDAWQVFRELQRRAYITRTWGDCYGYLLVATGRAEVMVDPVMKVWDAAALQPILEEAGGTFTDWSGNSHDLSRRGDRHQSARAGRSAGDHPPLCPEST